MILEWWIYNSPYKDKDGIIADGSIRSGKTTVMSLSFVIWAMDTFDGENFALCGKTIQSLRRNVIKQLKKMLKSRGYTVEEHRSENSMTIKYCDVENEFYLFGGQSFQRSTKLRQLGFPYLQFEFRFQQFCLDSKSADEIVVHYV